VKLLFRGEQEERKRGTNNGNGAQIFQSAYYDVRAISIQPSAFSGQRMVISARISSQALRGSAARVTCRPMTR
jgi:hypothetical protein